MKYRKKPVIIEAVLVSDLLEKFKHNWRELPEWVKNAYEDMTINTITDNGFNIKTLEGNYAATINDYLIKGVQGEIYPCKIEIFRQTYELVGEE